MTQTTAIRPTGPVSLNTPDTPDAVQPAATPLEQVVAGQTPVEKLRDSDDPARVAQAVPNPQPGPSRNIADHVIGEYRAQINAAGGRYGVAPEAIGGILFDELTHRSFEDDRQDQLAAQVAATPPNSQARTDAIASANGDWMINPPTRSGKNIASNVTIGNTQLSVDGVRKLVNSENGKNYLEGIINREDFNKDPVGNSLKLLTNDTLSPFLVGAWARKQIDTRSGQQRDGITYPRFGQAENRDLHYVFLTGTYSQGGYFKGADGKIDKDKTADPLRYTDFSRATGPNTSATDGLSYREQINSTLNNRPWP